MKVNGHKVSSAKGINNGTERAVSNEERLNILLEQARQTQTDISPNNWTPTKLACVEIDNLRGDLNIAKLQLRAAAKMNERQSRTILKYQDSIAQFSEKVVQLERPLWVKIVAWFAR